LLDYARQGLYGSALSVHFFDSLAIFPEIPGT
jgi:hypothetical protein